MERIWGFVKRGGRKGTQGLRFFSTKQTNIKKQSFVLNVELTFYHDQTLYT